MKNLLSLVLVACIGFATSAQASVLDVTLGLNPTDISYSSGGTLTPNIDLSTLSPAQLILSGAQIINPASSSYGQYAEPTGPIYANNYLSVFGGTAATFLLSTSNFGFTWGTIDGYNTLDLIDSRGNDYQITGSDILSALGPTAVSGTKQADVVFNDKFGAITTALLRSSSNSFEISNFSNVPANLSSVPLPSSLPLLLSALIGFGLLVHYRKTQKSS